MFEDKSQCIANCLMTEKGSHLLYRDYGTADVDSVSASLARRHIQTQLATFYPDVSISAITLEPSELGNGQFKYNIKLGD